MYYAHALIAVLLVLLVWWSGWGRASRAADAVVVMTDRRSTAKHGRRATDL